MNDGLAVRLHPLFYEVFEGNRVDVTALEEILDWIQAANHPQIQVKRIERDGELYVLTRSPAHSQADPDGRSLV
jgi:hypothetical protein